jgi:hypothetical protein
MAQPTVAQTKNLRRASIPTLYADVDQFEFIANAGTPQQKRYIYFDATAAAAFAATQTA